VSGSRRVIIVAVASWDSPAYRLGQKFPDVCVTVFEKEQVLG
jgi:hypothetical protein